MRYCKKCLTTDLRPNAYFDSYGVCIACNYSERQGTSGDKSLKLVILQKKLKEVKRSIGKNGDFDCIIGVSGGKDSTRQAHWVRDRLGLKPLLVCVGYPPKQMSYVGSKNLSNIISMGFDLIVTTPAPKTASKLTLESFKRFGNVCKSTEMSLFSMVPRLAIDFGVNIIFWGENPALQVGDAAVLGCDEFDGNNLRNLNTLANGGLDWIESVISKPYLLQHYVYPDELEFLKKKISIFYLGPAWDDWGNEENATYAALQGLTLRPNDENITGDISNASMLDEEFTNINMMLKYYKFGFGRATDLVCEKIRFGELTREQGISIVEQYDGVCDDEIIENFCEYVNISKNEFWTIANRWVNPDIFEITGNDRPLPKFVVGKNYD